MNPVLYVLDAPNMIRRAAALGEVRPGIEGVLKRFLKVAKPRFAVAVWDDLESSFRRDLWPQYRISPCRSRPGVQECNHGKDLEV